MNFLLLLVGIGAAAKVAQSVRSRRQVDIVELANPHIRQPNGQVQPPPFFP